MGILIRRILFLVVLLPTAVFAIEGKVFKSDKDVSVPTVLVTEIEQGFIKTVREEDPKDIRTDLQLKMEIPRATFAMSLFLEKKGGRSLDENVVFKIPAGGAQIELEPYVREGRGLFQMRAEFRDGFNKDEDLDTLKVYYVPRYSRLIQGKDIRGLGCDQIADITKFFKKAILNKGVLLTTTEQGYFPVVAGSYIFVVTHPTGLKVSSLSLMDSRFKNFLCPVKAGR